MYSKFTAFLSTKESLFSIRNICLFPGSFFEDVYTIEWQSLTSKSWKYNHKTNGTSVGE